MLRRCFQLCALLVFPCRDLRCAFEVIGRLLENPSGHGPERRLICLIYIKVRVAWVAHGGSPGVEVGVMAKPFPLNPKHPERICWGCDKYCATDALACGNGSGRTLHPVELQGEDWYVGWGVEPDPGRPAQAKKR